MSTIPALTDHALALVERARDPLEAVKLGPKLARVLREIKARHELAATASTSVTASSRRTDGGTAIAPDASGADWPLAALGCTHIVRLAGVAPLPPAAPGSLSISSAYKVEWPGGTGKVRSLFAGTTDGDPASLSRISVRISVNGTEELITDGEEEAYTPLLALQAANHNWFRLKDYEVNATQKWQVYFQNEGGPPGSPPLTPFLLFGYARETR